MGVPALFRWLSRKYPKIVSPVIESPSKDPYGNEIEVDISAANPNGEEFDNLYLDMNGIVHPCSHPEDRAPPANEDEMMLEVFRYTDRVISMVRPRKLLMIAVDGVAPRAKMNQQRSRRFRSAQEAEEKEKSKEEARRRLSAEHGASIPEEEPKAWDSNVITPGTPFMDILAGALRYWIQFKLNNDPAWKYIKVIISDASVPGEGEHKIMEFIRSQRANPAHDPNIKHVIYGLDADLIMLGLATHEPHFRVLREDVFFQRGGNGCRNCGEMGHYAAACTNQPKKIQSKDVVKKPFIWLHVGILREYLDAELHLPGQITPYDLERAIDDWVFIIFFVGNDFLPHLPSLDIREGAIDTLVALWKRNLDVQGGYITCDGTVNLERAQFMLNGLAEQEEKIFKKRKQMEERREQGNKDRARNAKRVKREPDYIQAPSSIPLPTTAALIEKGPVPASAPLVKNKGSKTIPEPLALHDLSQPINARSTGAVNSDVVANRRALRMGESLEANMSAAAKLRAQLMNATIPAVPTAPLDMPDDKTPVPSETTIAPGSPAKKRLSTELDESEVATSETVEEPEIIDTVNLGEEGYKERYYEQKFRVDASDIEFRRSIARDYVEGLAWVLLYYYQGCRSWTWFYPHHYAPFASDFDQISNIKIEFEHGEPARPYEQLLGVMPAASKHVLPEPLQKLMTDEEYGILDFYPTDFPIDLNGKKFAWQGVALLPFIDQSRLLEAARKGYEQLSKEELDRNGMGHDALFFSEQNISLFDDLAMKLYSKKTPKEGSKISLSPEKSQGLAGHVAKDDEYIPNSRISYPLNTPDEWPTIESDTSMFVRYFIPKSKHVHKSMLLKGVKLPRCMLDQADLNSVRYGNGGNGGGGGGRGNDRYGNNNRARDVFDPSTYHRPPPSFQGGNSSGNGNGTGNGGYPGTLPPWATAGPPGITAYGAPGQGQGAHTYFEQAPSGYIPPPLPPTGVPVPIPGFNPSGLSGSGGPSGLGGSESSGPPAPRYGDQNGGPSGFGLQGQRGEQGNGRYGSVYHPGTGTGSGSGYSASW